MKRKKEKSHKIKYSNINKKDLDIVLGNSYFNGDYTLKDELDKYGEDIIFNQYLVEDGKFTFFNAWTKNYVFSLVKDLMDDQIILGLKRNPPYEK